MHTEQAARSWPMVCTLASWDILVYWYFNSLLEAAPMSTSTPFRMSEAASLALRAVALLASGPRRQMPARKIA